MKLEHGTPREIEGESMRIIGQELEAMGIVLPAGCEAVVKRAIHTTADFDYARSLRFTPGAVEAGVDALRAGTALVTDTNMALSGVNRGGCERLGVERFCYMADPQVAERARAENTTRAAAAVDRWAAEHPTGIFAVGNAPTALLRLAEWMEAGKMRPALVIGAPVGFVNVVESKERIWSVCQDLDVPAIVAMGRKGGSTVAAAVCNALLYQAAGLR